MRGLKVCLFATLLFFGAYGLADLFFPSQMRAAHMGQDSFSAPHVAVVFLALTSALWYAFRNPVKNVAVIRATITLLVLDSMVGLYQAMTGIMTWADALANVALPVSLAAGLVYFYPRGATAT